MSKEEAMRESPSLARRACRSALVVALVGPIAISGPVDAAFVATLPGGVLTLTQTVDDGAITIDNNGGGNAFRTIDGSGTVTYIAATHLAVNLLNSTGNQLDLDLDNTHTGNVTLNVGNSLRLVNFTGTMNSIGGNLVVNSGTGNQNVEISKNANLGVTGSMTASLGTGFDLIDEDGMDTTIGTDLTLIDVNQFENNGIMNVGGNVVHNSSADNGTADFDNDGVMNITGNFTYVGNNLGDNVNTNADFNVNGTFTANTAAGFANYNLNNPNVDILGAISLTATETTAVDDLDTAVGADLGGNFLVDYGDGPNNADFFGGSTGTTGNYNGGTGVDTVGVNLNAPTMDLVVLLNGGNDILNLNAATQLNSLTVDFGCGGTDTFNDGFGGTYPFPATIINLAGPCVGLPATNRWTRPGLAALLLIALAWVLARRGYLSSFRETPSS